MGAEDKDFEALRTHYARIAQLTTIFLPPVVIRLIQLWHYPQYRTCRPRLVSSPSDTYQQKQALQRLPLRRFKVLGNRLWWWTQDEAVSGWGTRAEWMMFVATLSWMLFLSIHNTAYDYIEITRRLGLIGASLVPINMLLIMKSQSLVCLLGGFSEEQMNPYHQIVGRIMIILTTAHGAMFFMYFVQNNMISTRLFDVDILVALASVAMFLTIGFTSLAWFRRRHYRTFFIIHISLSFLMLPALYFHTPHLRSYIVEAAIIYIINRGLRLGSTRVLWAEVKHQDNSNLLSISFLPSKAGIFPVYPIGSFVYFAPGGSSAIRTLLKSTLSNPFTITMNSPKEGPRIIVRPRKGNTASFDTMLKTTKIMVEGPYGHAAICSPSLADHLLEKCDNFFFCAGGVGATFTMSIATAVLHSMNNEPEDAVRKHFQVMWAVRSLADVSWAFEDSEISTSRYQLKDFVRIFVTQDLGSEDEIMFSDSEDEADESIELQKKEGEKRIYLDGLNVTKGRPIVGVLVDEFFDNISSSDTNCVVTCGPEGLNRSLRKEVSRYVRKGQNVIWQEEKFSR